jgi:intracellular septation protein A
MRIALVQLLSDFLSAIVFLIIYGSTENLYLATGAAIAVSLAQFSISKIRGRPVDAMQWLVLGMVIVLGSAALITQDSRFVMVKPSIVRGGRGHVAARLDDALFAADRSRQHSRMGRGPGQRHRTDRLETRPRTSRMPPRIAASMISGRGPHAHGAADPRHPSAEGTRTDSLRFALRRPQGRGGGGQQAWLG